MYNTNSLDTICGALSYAMGIDAPAEAAEKNAVLLGKWRCLTAKAFLFTRRVAFCERIGGTAAVLAPQMIDMFLQ